MTGAGRPYTWRRVGSMICASPRLWWLSNRALRAARRGDMIRCRVLMAEYELTAERAGFENPDVVGGSTSRDETDRT